MISLRVAIGVLQEPSTSASGMFARHGSDPYPLVLADSRRLFLQETIMFFLYCALIPHRLLPALFQAASHQAVLGLDGPILPFGTLRLIGRPLQALFPVPAQPLAFLFDVLNRSHAQFKGRRLQDHEDLLSNQIVDYPG